jgi:signal transduction histidine kinase
LTVPADLPTLRSDRLKVYQIFTNLIGNAIKYRSPERPVTITIAAMRTNEGRTLRITVQDNGTGIPADKFDLVFRPFQRAHTGAVEGSGIGLATVKKLVARFRSSPRARPAQPSRSIFGESSDDRGACRR